MKEDEDMEEDGEETEKEKRRKEKRGEEKQEGGENKPETRKSVNGGEGKILGTSGLNRFCV